jgi:subfamily B ATP-binding cassette protein HlyB/CyaB
MLLNRSIRDNLLIGNPDATEADLERAAREAEAHDFIREQPQGYDTEVGERGATLSGGQRQRLAIARALVGDPRILIFDEATSALDYESESIIQRNMRKIVGGRTVFIVAHRLSAVRVADRILTIEEGVVTEDGRHEDLVAANGRYATLLRLQSGLA